MSSSRCEALNWMLVPLSMAASGIVSGMCDVLKDNEVLVLQVLSAGVTVAHVHYGICVVRQMTRHFNINCFSLKKSTNKSKAHFSDRSKSK